MITIWSPDTCDCKIEYNKQIHHIRTYAKCRLHQPLNNQTLLDAVISYNQSFNLAFGRDELTEEEQKVITLSKALTKQMIRRGDFSQKPPVISTPSRIERLRNLLRI